MEGWGGAIFRIRKWLAILPFLPTSSLNQRSWHRGRPQQILLEHRASSPPPSLGLRRWILMESTVPQSPHHTRTSIQGTELTQTDDWTWSPQQTCTRWSVTATETSHVCRTVMCGVAQLVRTSVYDRRTFSGLRHDVQLMRDLFGINRPLYVSQHGQLSH